MTANRPRAWPAHLPGPSSLPFGPAGGHLERNVQINKNPLASAVLALTFALFLREDAVVVAPLKQYRLQEEPLRYQFT